MIINFRARKISQGGRKLTRILTIKKTINNNKKIKIKKPQQPAVHAS